MVSGVRHAEKPVMARRDRAIFISGGRGEKLCPTGPSWPDKPGHDGEGRFPSA